MPTSETFFVLHNLSVPGFQMTGLGGGVVGPVLACDILYEYSFDIM